MSFGRVLVRRLKPFAFGGLRLSRTGCEGSPHAPREGDRHAGRDGYSEDRLKAELVRLRACTDREVRVLSRQNAYQPVTGSNCVAERRGGKQQEVNDQSVG